MNTLTTVGSARKLLGNLFTADDFIPYLCQSLERLTNSGLWKGAIGYAEFPTVNNYFTLPYPFLSVIGADWWRWPVPVFSQFHNFVPGGPGLPMPNLPPSGIVRDMGDGYATIVDPPTLGSTLIVVPDLVIDNGKVFRFYGNSNGREIFDVNGAGMNVTVNFPSTSVAMVFDVVTGIQVPTDPTTGASTMVGGWTLYSVAPDTTQTKLGYYYPNETAPSYRRYQFGTSAGMNADNTPSAVTVLVRRRYMPIYKETDWVVPGNIGALKFAMQAIDSEASKNLDQAQTCWDAAYKALDQELHATRGAVRPEINYSGLGLSLTNVY